LALVWLWLCLAIPSGDVLNPEVPISDDDRELREQVEYLLSHPLDLNRASAVELQEIPWLSPLLAFRIVEFRDSVGPFDSVAGLRVVPGISMALYESLVPLLVLPCNATPGWEGSVLVRCLSDSIPVGQELGVFGRARVCRGPWTANATIEKDAGEPSLADWHGFSLAYASSPVHVVGGDYTVGSGLGLVFSGPHGALGERYDQGVSRSTRLRVPSSAQESRVRRGGGLELFHRGWMALAFGSYRRLDARLNEDGSIARLRLDGVHDDSASRAERSRVDEASGGGAVSYQTGAVQVGAAGGGVRYDRAFSPSESTGSLAGNRVGFLSLFTEARPGSYRVQAEGGWSTGGGLAGAVDLSGRWTAWSVDAGLSAYQADFFAPLGRWRTLTGRRPRAHARALIAYHHDGLGISVRGNTYRDFDEDSLPAKLEMRVEQRAGRLDIGVLFGWRYRLERQRHRMARLDVEYKPVPGISARLRLEDRYPEEGTGRGLMAGAAVRSRVGPVRVSLSSARFVLRGPGVRMYWPEYGPMRVGSGFGTSESCWRFSSGVSLELSRDTMIGVRLGCSLVDGMEFDFGTQLQIGLS